MRLSRRGKESPHASDHSTGRGSSNLLPVRTKKGEREEPRSLFRLLVDTKKDRVPSRTIFGPPPATERGEEGGI